MKNRRKNGGHDWVRANAAPVMRNGALAGFHSLRTKPSPAEIQVVELLYCRFRERRAGGLRLFRGRVVRSSPLTRQAAEMEQLNLAVARLDEMTQQNAALVEQGAAAANALNQQSESTKNAVGIFV